LTAPILAQLAVITSAICYGASATFTRYYAGHASGRVMATGAMLAGLLWMLPVTLILEQPWQTHPGIGGLAAIAYLGLLPTALAALLFFYLVPRLGANNFAQINYLIPVLGALWGVIFLGETASWRLLTALALVLSAITIVRKRTPGR
jgi:drug/metabolite transporter (DMT)-like permease